MYVFPLIGNETWHIMQCSCVGPVTLPITTHCAGEDKYSLQIKIQKCVSLRAMNKAGGFEDRKNVKLSTLINL